MRCLYEWTQRADECDRQELKRQDQAVRCELTQRIAAAKEAIAKIQQYERKTPASDAKLAAHSWHSMVVTATIYDGTSSKVVDMLADSGAALTIQRARDLLETVRQQGLAPCKHDLLQAGGEPLPLIGTVQGASIGAPSQ